MKENKNRADIVRNLRSQLAKAANAYALELHRQWGVERTVDDYWIGGVEDPCVAPYSMHSNYFISLDTMQYIVDNGISQEEYDRYQEYVHIVASASDRLHVPKLREWRAHPERRYDIEALEHIQILQADICREVERIQNGSNGFTD